MLTFDSPIYPHSAHNDDPHHVVTANSAYSALLDDDGDVLPIVDAFCKGYAEAILFANAYHYVPCDAPDAWDGTLLEQEEYAQYNYQSPGKWWEGMGIDFSDAIDFLAANMHDLRVILLDAEHADENRNVAPSLIRWNVYEQHGHDFALTRNHHGAGFWDRGYGDVGDRLTEAAQAYGEHSVLTDDGPTVTTL